jgi:hypothetical protein
MACVLQEKPIRVKAEQGLVNEAQAAKVRKPLHNVMDSPGLSQQETNKRHCERCGQGAELQLLHNATQQALAQSQAHVGRLSNALLTAGCSNQADRLQMGKLHSTLGAQIVELEHASARAIELEHTLQTERLNHNATREALVARKAGLKMLSERSSICATFRKVPTEFSVLCARQMMLVTSPPWPISWIRLCKKRERNFMMKLRWKKLRETSCGKKGSCCLSTVQRPSMPANVLWRKGRSCHMLLPLSSLVSWASKDSDGSFRAGQIHGCRFQPSDTSNSLA